ncbi:DEAD/DEAH box helicase [Pontibacter sp. G13]|uniref:DEAD/DEAH box helicase n=1 Tax=Pontibacter sp. G13 TaxID=3074898 RepID=UPI00288C0503|nr:DEAD/DEAH box helicase [Pontibacter sp. G13]WNJ17264.1 DEAD/DEAH box helicase [Pontibacter sp. G13]
MKFTDFALTDTVLDSIESLGFEDATPIQQAAIPEILEGKDLIACAQTGTGKTAAYLVPTINRLTLSESDKTRALVISPTRELAEQIDQNVEALSYFTGISSVPIIGGKDAKGFDRQKYALTHGTDIVIATPGRLITHAALGYVNFDEVEVLILDEADKMLDMGFHADILKIVDMLPKERQTLLFSATMPANIRKLAKEIMAEPAEINLNLAKPAEGVTLSAYVVYPEQKIPLLEDILSVEEVDSMIIFASSKASVDEITRTLSKRNHDVRAIHSDKEQEERAQTLRDFKNRTFNILVGTDVLARGIDIDNLSHVLNFDCPKDAEDYVHRVGRTARASSTGEAITFVSPMDMHRLGRIERLIEREVPKMDVPEELGETPTYNPGRGKGGRGKGGGGNRRGGGGGNRRGGGNHRGGGRRNGNSQNRGGQGPRNSSEGNRDGNAQGGGNRNRNRNRNRRRNRKPGGSPNSAPKE